LLSASALLVLAAACGGKSEKVSGQPLADAAKLHLVRIASFSSPVYVASPPGDSSRVFVVEQQGRVMLVKNGRKLGTPFLDITGDVQSGGERGLLSVAFAPDYSSSGRFYVYYTDKGGDIRVEEFRRSSNADRADKGSRRLVLFQEHSQFPNHNGGQLQFGPD